MCPYWVFPCKPKHWTHVPYHSCTGMKYESTTHGYRWMTALLEKSVKQINISMNLLKNIHSFHSFSFWIWLEISEIIVTSKSARFSYILLVRESLWLGNIWHSCSLANASIKLRAVGEHPEPSQNHTTHLQDVQKHTWIWIYPYLTTTTPVSVLTRTWLSRISSYLVFVSLDVNIISTFQKLGPSQILRNLILLHIKILNNTGHCSMRVS